MTLLNIYGKNKKNYMMQEHFTKRIFRTCIDENKDNHYMISDVITDLRQNYPFLYQGSSSSWVPFMDIEDPGENLRLYVDFSWTPLHVSDRIKIYNEHVDNLQRKIQSCKDVVINISLQ